jgi:hypothetical protein
MTGAIASERFAVRTITGAAPTLGVIEWLRPGEHERALRLIEGLQRIGISELRTGISWAHCHEPGGRAWYDWLLPRLAAELNVLPCFTYTPPSLGIEPKTSAPPRDPKAYADFLDVMLSEHGQHFEWVELWNEPNNLNDWDWRLDPDWHRFCEMIGGAAYWARQRGKRTVLGGMCPTDSNWLALVAERGVLQYIDAIGLHAFPATWDHDWQGWEHLIAQVRRVLEARGPSCGRRRSATPPGGTTRRSSSPASSMRCRRRSIASTGTPSGTSTPRPRARRAFTSTSVTIISGWSGAMARRSCSTGCSRRADAERRARCRGFAGAGDGGAGAW